MESNLGTANENESNINKKQEIPKNAIYLGLLIVEPLPRMNEYIKGCFSAILDNYPDMDEPQILFNLFNSPDIDKENLNIWRFPKPDKKWHITTLFKKKTFDRSHPAFREFQKGENVKVNIKAFVYVPGKILTSLVFTNVSIENEFPHMTTLLAGWKPKNSNDICCELFSKGMHLEIDYKNLRIDEGVEEECYVIKREIKVLDKNEIIYFYKFASPINLNTSMTIFFN